jgi:hypothetical protein
LMFPTNALGNKRVLVAGSLAALNLGD